MQILQVAAAFVSLALNVYLVGCFVFSPDIRELKNYPIFLLTVIDLVVTGPGFCGRFVSEQFIRYHSSNKDQHGRTIFTSQGFGFYNNLRSVLQGTLQPAILGKVDPFWFSCLPDLLLVRLNEYGNGPCALILAYERFVLVCKPLKKSTLLSSFRRKLMYTFATAVIMISFLTDAICRYVFGSWYCAMFRFNDNTKITYGMPLLTGFIYSLVPAVLCIGCYFSGIFSVFIQF